MPAASTVPFILQLAVGRCGLRELILGYRAAAGVGGGEGGGERDGLVFGQAQIAAAELWVGRLGLPAKSM